MALVPVLGALGEQHQHVGAAWGVEDPGVVGEAVEASGLVRDRQVLGQQHRDAIADGLAQQHVEHRLVGLGAEQAAPVKLDEEVRDVAGGGRVLLAPDRRVGHAEQCRERGHVVVAEAAEQLVRRRVVGHLDHAAERLGRAEPDDVLVEREEPHLPLAVRLGEDDELVERGGDVALVRVALAAGAGGQVVDDEGDAAVEGRRLGLERLAHLGERPLLRGGGGREGGCRQQGGGGEEGGERPLQGGGGAGHRPRVVPGGAVLRSRTRLPIAGLHEPGS